MTYWTEIWTIFPQRSRSEFPQVYLKWTLWTQKWNGCCKKNPLKVLYIVNLTCWKLRKKKYRQFFFQLDFLSFLDSDQLVQYFQREPQAGLTCNIFFYLAVSLFFTWIIKTKIIPFRLRYMQKILLYLLATTFGET